MAFDKIQTQAIDVDTAPVKGSVNNSDYVLIRDVTTGDLQRILVSDLLAGSSGAIRLHGEADMTDASTTLTKIVIDGDANNATIEQGKAPVDVSPNGIAYTVKAPQGGVETQISGVTERVFPSDQIVWTGSKWSVLAVGATVTSVNGHTGDVTGLATVSDLNDYYTKLESDNKYYNKSESDSRYLSSDIKPLQARGSVSADLGEFPTFLGVTRASSANPNKPSGGSYGNLVSFYNPGADTAFQLYANYAYGKHLYFKTGNRASWPTTWDRIYTTLDKPTLTELGAAPAGEAYTKAESDNLLGDKLDLAGGRLTGPLVIGSPRTDQVLELWGSSKDGQETVYQSYFNKDGTVRWGYDGFTSHDSGTWRRVNARPNGKFSFATSDDNDYQCFEINGKKIFNEGYLPTASQVGALPDTTPLFSGNYADLKGIPTYFDTTWSRIDGKPTTFTPSVHDHNNLYYTKQEVDGKGYLLKSVADTEYAPISHNHNSLYYSKSQVDTKLNEKLSRSGGTVGDLVAASNSASPKLILHRTDLDYHVQMAFQGNSTITYFGTNSNGNLAYGSSNNLSANGAEIYSTANKPTAADVGALTQSQGDARYIRKSGLANLDLHSSSDSSINMHAGTNKNVSFRMWEAADQHGAYIQYRGATDNAVVFGTYSDKNPTQTMYFRRGSNNVYVNGDVYVEGHSVDLGNKTRISGTSKYFAITSTDSNKTGYFGARNSSWFHMETDAPNGFYSYNDFNMPNLNLRGIVTSGSWSGGNHSVRIRNDFYDSTWGKNGTAAYGVNKGDSTGAHWAFASYYDGTNIRAGIQILTNSDGRMRFYTNRRSNYVEVHSGQVFAGSGQSPAVNAYTRKDYVDSKIAAIPTARPSESCVGNDGTDRTSGVRQGHVTWYARNWSGKTFQSSNLLTWVSPTTGFKVVNSGIYEIEATDTRRVRSSGQDDQVSLKIQVNGSTKVTNSCSGRDNDVVPITARWVGHLSAGNTIRFIAVGGQIAVGGANFKVRYIKP